MSVQPEVSPAGLSPGALGSRLDGLVLRDRQRIVRRLDGLRRRGTAGQTAEQTAEKLARVAADVERAEQRVARRRSGVPPLHYPPELPVSAAREQIAAAIRDHQVVVVAGETGSGKTTQLPKICLELGRGVTGAIGHTQPRRIAARAVAERVAEELGTPLGGPDALVGYKVRFHDDTSADTLVKVMTDGILLAEVQGDRSLEQYDTLILDEAHERSLNIDFLLGYLKLLLPRRPDLKVVITSATLETQRFREHFDGAPVVEVSGRGYPVEVRYRPPVDDDVDPVQALTDAVDELCAEGPGDVLVFLSGEREIRDAADALRRTVGPATEVLPLYARLSAAEQHRVFAPHPVSAPWSRRVVLATNVAETSLTVPGIHYVVDPGTARISRYSTRRKVQRLPIEPVSQASASQRAGRCGRVAAGVCIRLYAEEDLAGRPAFTDPEILRTNLASVILQMTALGLGDIEKFPFVQPPDRRSIRDGMDLLHELGALDLDQPDPRRRLTDVGRALAQLPVDPRLGRMVLEGGRNGCLREVLVIVAALSIQDPRERPQDRQQAAAEQHARFSDEGSDFLSYLRLWEHLRERQRELSSGAFRRTCKAEFLHYLRVREWQDLHGQLRQAAKAVGLGVNDSPAAADVVHQSLRAGLLSHLGLRDPEKRDYLGARSARFALVPGSVLARTPPRWVMAAELVETERLWGRVAARIQPEWVEAQAQHLVRRSYSEPHWERKQGAVMAYERVTLYGVPLAARRKVSYGRVDPVLSRELFLRHALVEGDWDTRHAFFERNRALLEEVEELEHRARRRDIVVDDQTLFDFYDARVPADVVSAAHFDSWWKDVRREQPELLTFSTALLVHPSAEPVSALDYPDVWLAGDLRLPLTYQFEPGADADGVTVHVPVAVLNRLDAAGFDWQVPGLRQDLVTALLRSLPKALRKSFVPAPDTARFVLHRLEPRAQPLLPALSGELRALRGVGVPDSAWDVSRVPEHLRMAFRVEDEHGRTLAEGRDLPALQERLRPRLQQALSSAGRDLERSGLRAWTVGSIPPVVHSGAVTGYPALVDEGESVALRVPGSRSEQDAAMHAGTRRLLLLTVPSPVRAVAGRLSNPAKLALTGNPHGSVAALLADCTAAAVDALTAEAGGPAWDEAGFERLREAVRAGLEQRMQAALGEVEKVLAAWQEVGTALAQATAPPLAGAADDMRAQVDALVRPGVVTATGTRRLPDLLRYLRAVLLRLDKLRLDPARDRLLMERVHAVQEELTRFRAELPPARRGAPEVLAIEAMVQELRVSLFAQQLRTPYPVSEQRIYRAMDAVAG